MIRIEMILRKATVMVGMFLLLGVVSSQAATLTVTTTADAGAGSFRQAIIDATANAEANTVIFDISLTDPGYTEVDNRFTIALLSPLPDLPLAALIIDNNQTQALTVKGDNTFRIFTLVNSSVVTINNITISNGFSEDLGGAIFMGNSSTLHLNRSTVSNNSATDGGGIYINDSGTLNIDASAVIGNTAVNNGGGIVVGTSGTMNATNNTFDGNIAGANGGGIYNTATITLTNNTISSNAGEKGGGVYNDFTATLNNNIVALNTAFDGSDLLGRGSLGVAFTGIYNLIGNADGSEGLTSVTNQFGSTLSPIDTLIGPLQDNGGATFTRQLFTGSPAIDKGSSPVIITDQRGQARPYDILSIPNASGGDGSDIGAFEAQGPTSIDVSIGGRALSGFGTRGVSGAIVYLTDMNGITRTTLTNPFGYYQFTGVQTGEVYVFTVRHKRYQFDPLALSVIEEMAELNFMALP